MVPIFNHKFSRPKTGDLVAIRADGQPFLLANIRRWEVGGNGDLVIISRRGNIVRLEAGSWLVVGRWHADGVLVAAESASRGGSKAPEVDPNG